MHVTVGYSETPDSRLGAREAVEQALNKSNRKETCDMVLLFSTSNHDSEILRREVAEMTGNDHSIYGGGAVGIITNEAFGYAGDQIGVALIWLDESECKATIVRELSSDERAKGVELGKKLAEANVTHDSNVMMFYDAMRPHENGLGMTMATWLLEGIEEGLGCFPDMNGAGLQGDFIGGQTAQYTGKSIEEDTAIALTFSDDVCIDSVIMHGCRPASPYYTVTKAEGPIILEINNTPAIEFIDGIVGASIKPEQYPFFLLFGINHGEKWGAYDENNYASRLCLGIDPERGGIIMFEPDMVEGTQFQLMSRSLNMSYMQPKIDEVFSRLDGREPVFAIYINCAGRSAGYNGVDVEDAYVIQNAMGGKIPLLGLYTGVEISEIGGRPRGLDWTGVLCLFSVNKSGETHFPRRKTTELWGDHSGDDSSEIPIEPVLEMLEQNVSKIFDLDTKSIDIRYELELKRRGFRLLSDLSTTLHQNETDDSVLYMVAKRINGALNMQRTMYLRPDSDGYFVPAVMQGYDKATQTRLAEGRIKIDSALLFEQKCLIVTGADGPDTYSDLREGFGINNFIMTPVVVEGEVMGILVTGRMIEATPFMVRLSMSDAENVMAITSLLSSVLVYERLDFAKKKANTDPLTGILNRNALETLADEALDGRTDNDQMFALLVIDIDLFKNVNDTYGHLAGDAVLKALAAMLKKNFRSSDLIARIGGDEFVVFCSFNNIDILTTRINRLIDAWRNHPLKYGEELIYSTLSIGVSVSREIGLNYTDLFAEADHALYHSKYDGRDRFSFASGDVTKFLTSN